MELARSVIILKTDATIDEKRLAIEAIAATGTRAGQNVLINYLLRPEIAARNSNFLSYANGNLASQKLIEKVVLDDPTVYPDEATMKRLYTITAKDQKTTRIANRLWTRVKTGR